MSKKSYPISETLTILSSCTEITSKVLHSRNINVRKDEIFDKLMEIVVSSEKRNEVSANVSADKADEHYSVTADLLCLAYDYHKKGNSEKRNEALALAFEADDSNEFIQAIASVNNSVEQFQLDNSVLAEGDSLLEDEPEVEDVNDNLSGYSPDLDSEDEEDDDGDILATSIGKVSRKKHVAENFASLFST